MLTITETVKYIGQLVHEFGKDFIYSDGTLEFSYRPLSPIEVGYNNDDPRTKTGCLIGSILSKVGETSV